jgi:hypothetical protein
MTIIKTLTDKMPPDLSELVYRWNISPGMSAEQLWIVKKKSSHFTKISGITPKDRILIRRALRF